MRYVLVLCCKWYRPEAEAASRGEEVDYDPLRLAIACDEQACDRMNLPHNLQVEGAGDLMLAHVGWMHETQSILEARFDLETGHAGFEASSHVVDVISTHELNGPDYALIVAMAFRESLVDRADGSEVGIGPIVAISEPPLSDHNPDRLYREAQVADAFNPGTYCFVPASSE